MYKISWQKKAVDVEIFQSGPEGLTEQKKNKQTIKQIKTDIAMLTAMLLVWLKIHASGPCN